MAAALLLKQHPLEILDLCRCPPLRRKPRAIQLQIITRLHNVLCALFRDWNNLNPLATHIGDIPFLLQLQQCLAHRRAADIQFAAQRILRIGNANLQPTV